MQCEMEPGDGSGHEDGVNNNGVVGIALSIVVLDIEGAFKLEDSWVGNINFRKCLYRERLA